LRGRKDFAVSRGVKIVVESGNGSVENEVATGTMLEVAMDFFVDGG